MSSFSADDFEPHQSTTFDTEGVSLVLVGIDRLAPQPHAPRHHPFTLLFIGPNEQVLTQGTYRLRHPEMGQQEIFLVPLGPGPEGPTRYQAVFN